MVLVVAALLIAVPAWSQGGNSEDSRKDGKASEKQKKTQKNTPQSAESLAARLAPNDPTARHALETAAHASASADLDNKTADDRSTDGDTAIDTIDISDARDCNVELGDSITFDVTGGTEGVTLAT